MVLYEPIIGNTVFNNILEYKDLIRFINEGNLKKEYEKSTLERKEKFKNAQSKN